LKAGKNLKKDFMRQSDEIPGCEHLRLRLL